MSVGTSVPLNVGGNVVGCARASFGVPSRGFGVVVKRDREDFAIGNWCIRDLIITICSPASLANGKVVYYGQEKRSISSRSAGYAKFRPSLGNVERFG